jgi:hypothetical protein
MELSDVTEKAPATPEIDPGTFRLVAHYLNHYANPGPYVGTQSPEKCREKKQTYKEKLCTKLALFTRLSPVLE